MQASTARFTHCFPDRWVNRKKAACIFELTIPMGAFCRHYKTLPRQKNIV